MRLSRLFSTTLVIGIATTATIFACGGGGGGGQPDAKQFKDAKVFMDAGPGLTGLGQSCGGSADPACPANASDCIGPGGSDSFCTPICDMNGSGSANGSGQLLFSAITPAPNNATCTAAFTGSAGTPSCYATVMSTPTLGTTPNQHYTGIQIDCAVLCGTGSGSGPCPTGMTCNAASGICLPNL